MNSGSPSVFFFKVFVQGGYIYLLLNKGLVVRPVGVEVRHEAVQGVKVFKPYAVLAVAPFYPFSHLNYSSRKVEALVRYKFTYGLYHTNL